MKSLIIYDSLYGNTKKIALAIKEELGKDSKAIFVKNAKNSDLKDIKLLIIGSPTHAGRPTKTISDFISNISKEGLKNVKITSFDTSISKKGKNFFLKFIINTFGYAAKHIAKSLKDKGGNLIISPKGFLVLDKEGPLEKNQLKLAKDWANQIIKK